MWVISKIQYSYKINQTSVWLYDIVIKKVNGIAFFMDLYLRNQLDFVLGEFSFENLYYLNKKRKILPKKLGKDSS